MDSLDLFFLAGTAAYDAVCIVAFRRNWDERLVERKRDSEIAWFWLSVFGIERSARNCVRLVRGSRIASAICMTLGCALTIWLRHR